MSSTVVISKTYFRVGGKSNVPMARRGWCKLPPVLPSIIYDRCHTTREIIVRLFMAQSPSYKLRVWLETFYGTFKTTHRRNCSVGSYCHLCFCSLILKRGLMDVLWADKAQVL